MNQRPTPPKATKFTYAVLLLACMMWASGGTFSKIALQNYSPEFMIFFRVAIAAALLTPLVLIKLWPIKIYSRKDLFWIIVLLFFDPIGFTAFETVGMQFTSASQAGMIWATGPIINTIAALIVLREKTSWQVLACFLAAACGVILLTTTGGESDYAPNPLVGNLLVLMTLLCAAAFKLIVRFLGGRYNPLFLVWVQCLGASLFMLPLFPMGYIPLPDEVSLVPTLALVYLGVGLTMGAQCLSCYTTARLPIARSAAFANLIPIFGLSYGIILLGETLLPIQWGACALILAAVLASQYFQADCFKQKRMKRKAQKNTV
ncbi:MAG: DMT family transporter [Desulfovibrionaceae bacterium]|nr:DMT family transporter [Desulfovibrionaceae bacterium]